MNGLISYNGHYVKEASRATCFFRSVKFDIMRVEPGTVVRGDAFLPELATDALAVNIRDILGNASSIESNYYSCSRYHLIGKGWYAKIINLLG
jgi:hypothetical protein